MSTRLVLRANGGEAGGRGGGEQSLFHLLPQQHQQLLDYQVQRRCVALTSTIVSLSTGLQITYVS